MEKDAGFHCLRRQREVAGGMLQVVSCADGCLSSVKQLPWRLLSIRWGCCSRVTAVHSPATSLPLPNLSPAYSISDNQAFGVVDSEMVKCFNKERMRGDFHHGPVPAKGGKATVTASTGAESNGLLKAAVP